MKNSKIKVKVIVTVLLACIMIVGLLCWLFACNQNHTTPNSDSNSDSNSNGHSAIGNWVSVSYTSNGIEDNTGVDKMLLEISDGGICYLMDGGKVALGSWEIISNNEISIKFDFDSNKWKLIIDNERLHLILDDDTLNFERTDMQIPHV